MDETFADLFAEIPVDGETRRGDDGTLDAGIEAGEARKQERLFREELTRWSAMSPGSADTAMNPFSSEPGLARLVRSASRSSAPEDVQSQLRALSARNAFLSLALDAAVAESANLKAEHAEMATVVAQSTVARQRHEAEIADVRKTQQLLRTELDGMRAENSRLQGELQSTMALLDERGTQSSSEIGRLTAEAAEATRARQHAEAELTRLQRSHQHASERIEHQRGDIERLQSELRAALSENEEYETRRIAEQVDFTAAAAEAAAARKRVETDLKRLQQKQRQTGAALSKLRGENRQLQNELATARRALEAQTQAVDTATRAGADELARLRADLAAAVEREADVCRQRDEAQAALQRAATEAADEHRQLEAQLGEARGAQQRMAKMLEHLQAEAARLRQQIEHAGAHEREVTARWETERNAFVLAVDDAAERRRRLEAELQEARQTQHLLGAGIGQARHEIERLSRLQPRLESAERERDALRVSKEQAVEQLKHLLEVAKQEAAASLAAMKAAEAERDELAAQLPFRDAAMQAMRDEIESLKAKQSEPAAQAMVQKGGAAAAATIRRLEARLAAQAENRQRHAEELRELRRRIAELEANVRPVPR